MTMIISISYSYDICVMLGEESTDYPGDTPYGKDAISTIQDSGNFDLSKLTMSSHSGTHVDLPAHFVLRGKAVDAYSVEDFILPITVVEIRDRVVIRPGELEHLLIEPGDALLFNTSSSRHDLYRSSSFSSEYVYPSPEAADICVANRAGLVGIDYISVEQYDDHTYPVKRTLLENTLLILEGLDLTEIPPGRYTLICLPLKIKGSEASPVRAILLA